jgi:hypothetical protein
MQSPFICRKGLPLGIGFLKQEFWFGWVSAGVTGISKTGK